MKKMIDGKTLKFLLVGCINTLAGMIIMFGLYNIAGCSYWISSAANYIIVSILSYFLNRNFTFRHSGGVLTSSVRFIINIAFCYIAAYGAAKPLMRWALSGADVSLQENAAMMTGMCIFTVCNYLGQRFFVFREEKIMEYSEVFRRWAESSGITEEERCLLQNMTEEEKHEAFYKYAEFGTAGMRAVMGLGTNRLNKYTVRMAAKGMAQLLGEGSKVAVAYDTRNNSREFAWETARVLAASGIKAMIFDRVSPVPLLSFAVRDMGCDGGVVITASHNTREYNGFKVFDRTGCQMSPQLAGEIAENMGKLDDELQISVSAIDDESIKTVPAEVIDRFISAAKDCTGENGSDSSALKVVYTSLHGSGRDYVMKTLADSGFTDVLLVEEQADYNGDFPTVRKPNPEDPAAFEIAEKIAVKENADIIIGTDPDCDRLGIGVMHNGEMTCLTGNQTGVLFIDFLARTCGAEGRKLITTIVTGDMGPAVAESYGADVVRTFTGFKNIGKVMNEISDEEFFMGYEESYGYLAGSYARDKDGVSAALIACKMAAYWKSQGMTLVDVMDMLYAKHGYWIDQQQSFVFEGSRGAEKMKGIMEILREKERAAFAGTAEVSRFLDYKIGIDGFEPANVLKYVFENGSWIAVRPSGTEPKIKIYYCIKGQDKDAAEELYRMLKERTEALIS